MSETAAIQCSSGRGASAGAVFGHLLLALLDIAAGVVALGWPGVTALVLVFVAIWSGRRRAGRDRCRFGRDEAAGTRAYFILTGLVSVALGIVLFAHPRIGALSLAVVFGL